MHHFHVKINICTWTSGQCSTADGSIRSSVTRCIHFVQGKPENKTWDELRITNSVRFLPRNSPQIMQCGGMFVLSAATQRKSRKSRDNFRLLISKTHNLTWHVSMDNLGSSSVFRQGRIYSEESRRVHIVRSRGPQRNCMHLPYHVGNRSYRHRHRHRHRPYYWVHPKPS